MGSESDVRLKSRAGLGDAGPTAPAVAIPPLLLTAARSRIPVADPVFRGLPQRDIGPSAVLGTRGAATASAQTAIRQTAHR